MPAPRVCICLTGNCVYGPLWHEGKVSFRRSTLSCFYDIRTSSRSGIWSPINPFSGLRAAFGVPFPSADGWVRVTVAWLNLALPGAGCNRSLATVGIHCSLPAPTILHGIRLSQGGQLCPSWAAPRWGARHRGLSLEACRASCRHIRRARFAPLLPWHLVPYVLSSARWHAVLTQ